MPRIKACVAIASTPAPVVAKTTINHPLTPPPDKRGPLWITAAEAAAYLGLTIEALKGRAREGLLGFREGARWRFSRSDLERYAATVESGYLKTLRRR